MDSRRRRREARDTADIANPRLRLSPMSLSLSDVEDLRRFYPEDLRPALSRSGRFADLVDRNVNLSPSDMRRAPRPMRWPVVSRPAVRQPLTYRFKAPRKVVVCVRRQQRREVLMAKGRGGGGNRKPRWTERSHIYCR